MITILMVRTKYSRLPLAMRSHDVWPRFRLPKVNTRLERELRYAEGRIKPRYPVPVIPVRTVIDRDVVFQAWQYMIASNNAPLNVGRCLAGSYDVMLNHWRRGL